MTRPGGAWRHGASQLRAAAWTVAAAVGLVVAGCDRSVTEQGGYRGTAQVQVKSPAAVAALQDLNRIPPAEEAAELEAPPAAEVFTNVKVLEDLSATEVSRLMQAFSTWVSPVEGCDFCHDPDVLESDEKYPKVVARRMIEMTRRINTEWKSHVGETGVTCWTCHRGQAVPSGDWFESHPRGAAGGALGNRDGQSSPATHAVGSALPGDPLSYFLVNGEANVRIQGDTALLSREEPPTVKSAERTYSLMLYMSKSLGVNCTYCHSTRALASWKESTPQRATAWYGIRMVRELNTDYLIPLASMLPSHRMGPLGDGPKIGCETCHKGTFKPLNGVSPLTDYMALSGVGKVPGGVPTPAEEPAAEAEPAKKAVLQARK
jgi:photosynthetic reaction center cytochrome c subunit